MQDFCLLFFFLSFLPSFLSLPPTPKFSKGLDSLNWEDPSSSSSWMTECMSLGKLLNFFGLPLQFSSVQLSYSGVSDSATLQTAAHQVSLSITSSWSLLKLMSIKSVIPSKHLILCHPLFLQPIIFPSIRVLIQLSHLYMTTGKTIPLNTWTFVSKVMSLLFNTLSKFIIAFLPRNKYF